MKQKQFVRNLCRIQLLTGGSKFRFYVDIARVELLKFCKIHGACSGYYIQKLCHRLTGATNWWHWWVHNLRSQYIILTCVK